MTKSPLVVGDLFTMKEDAKPFEVRDDKKRLLARFLPRLTYSVTENNHEVAQKLVSGGKAKKGGESFQERLAKAGINLGTTAGKVKANLTVKTSRKKR